MSEVNLPFFLLDCFLAGMFSGLAHHQSDMKDCTPFSHFSMAVMYFFSLAIVWTFWEAITETHESELEGTQKDYQVQVLSEWPIRGLNP